MAGPGTDVGFPAGEFRTAIRAAMVMGSPNRELSKATFRWHPSRTYAIHDPAAEPYIWTATPASDLARPDVVVDEVAVEYTAARRLEGTDFGTFVPMRAELTILDVDQTRVDGANMVLLNEVPWAITAETLGGLFSVDIYTLFLERQ